MSTPLDQWVEQMARHTRPARVIWCDGSEAQQQEFFKVMLHEGHTVALNAKTHPNCYLHRSNPNDVARTEQVTFICTTNKEDAGPTNNWMAPADAKEKIGKLFEGVMAGRTMYALKINDLDRVAVLVDGRLIPGPRRRGTGVRRAL